MDKIQKQRGRNMAAPISHIEIDGQKYDLVFSNATARIAEDVYEEIYGKDVGFTNILLYLSNSKYKAIMAVFYAAMRAGGTDIDWQTFDEKFKLDSIEGIREIILKGVVDSLPQEDGETTARP